MLLDLPLPALWIAFLTGPEVGLLTELADKYRARFSRLTRYSTWPVLLGQTVAEEQQVTLDSRLLVFQRL